MDEQTGGASRGGNIAMPIVIGLLSLLLVTETIGLGYFAMQTVTQQSTEVEMLATNPEIVENVLETGSKEHPILSHVAFDGEKRLIPSGEDDRTYLRDQYLDGIEESPCKMTYQLADEAYRSNFGVTAEGVTDPDVRALFTNGISSTALAQLSNILEGRGQSLYQVCRGEATDYIITLDSASGSVATLATYVGESKQAHWQFFQPVNGVMDGAVWVIPEFFPDGSPLLTTGYGDAGYVWWNFWLPTPSGATYLIESCTEGPHYYETEAGENPVLAEGREITCEVEYVE